MLYMSVDIVRTKLIFSFVIILNESANFDHCYKYFDFNKHIHEKSKVEKK